MHKLKGNENEITEQTYLTYNSNAEFLFWMLKDILPSCLLIPNISVILFNFISQLYNLAGYWQARREKAQKRFHTRKKSAATKSFWKGLDSRREGIMSALWPFHAFSFQGRAWGIASGCYRRASDAEKDRRAEGFWFILKMHLYNYLIHFFPWNK